jgi:hypothetical protein
VDDLSQPGVIKAVMGGYGCLRRLRRYEGMKLFDLFVSHKLIGLRLVKNEKTSRRVARGSEND